MDNISIEQIRALLEEYFKNNSNASYIYDDGAGNTYLAYAAENGIATTDAKWMIKRIYDNGAGTTTFTYAINKDYSKKLDDGSGVPTTLAAYSYVYVKS